MPGPFSFHNRLLRIPELHEPGCSQGSLSCAMRRLPGRDFTLDNSIARSLGTGLYIHNHFIHCGDYDLFIKCMQMVESEAFSENNNRNYKTF